MMTTTPRGLRRAVPRGRPSSVLTTMAPHQAGALQRDRRFGDALRCVRHRGSADGRQRITTVELVLAVEPLRRRRAMGAEVAVRLDFRDREHRVALQQAGARWDAAATVWQRPRRDATPFAWAWRPRSSNERAFAKPAAGGIHRSPFLSTGSQKWRHLSGRLAV